MEPKAEDLTGMIFGRLTVIERCGKDRHGNALWTAKCECGNEITVTGHRLKHKITRSCGCLRKDVMDSHTGKNSLHWNGGKSVSQNGFTKIYVGNGKYVLEYKLIAEEVLGRELGKTERVFFVNGDKTDTRHENMVICSAKFYLTLMNKLKHKEKQKCMK